MPSARRVSRRVYVISCEDWRRLSMTKVAFSSYASQKRWLFNVSRITSSRGATKSQPSPSRAECRIKQPYGPRHIEVLDPIFFQTANAKNVSLFLLQ